MERTEPATPQPAGIDATSVSDPNDRARSGTNRRFDDQTARILPPLPPSYVPLHDIVVPPPESAPLRAPSCHQDRIRRRT
ncbi:hypothetical protein RB213_009394 [Colletotrichum asianum]